MNSMIGTLKCSYPSLTSDTMTEIMDNIQKSIRQKVNSLKIDREMMFRRMTVVSI